MRTPQSHLDEEESKRKAEREGGTLVGEVIGMEQGNMIRYLGWKH